MKNILKKLIEWKLKVISRLVVKKYNPKVVGITGSVGKTGTRDAVYTVLRNKYNVRKTYGNYNNEIGMPLTILGEQSPNKSLVGWMRVMLKGAALVLWRRPYPEILVLEMGVDKPGDIDYLCSIARPDIAIVTAISEIPVHLEFFKNPEALLKEKAKLVSYLKDQGVAVLNYDDPRARSVESGKAKAITYGFSEQADLYASNVAWNSEKLKMISGDDESLQGISYKLHYKENALPVRMPRVFGRPQVLSSLAAAACGLSLGMNLVEIAEALRDYTPPRGRMHLLLGIKNTYIIDDTYNASPDATMAALEVMASLTPEEGRKIAVLGDMLELGVMTEQGHRMTGKKAAEVVDVLVVVGNASKFTSDEAKKNGLREENIFEFADAPAAGLFIQNKILQEGDLLLVKGSQSMRMEKIVKELMAHPEQAADLLVRQSKSWIRK